MNKEQLAQIEDRYKGLFREHSLGDPYMGTLVSEYKVLSKILNFTTELKKWEEEIIAEIENI